MKTPHSGLVIGGPLDGKRLDHYDPRYSVAILTDAPPIPRPASLNYDLSNLVYARFDYYKYPMPGGFVWIPACLERGGTFEHRHYDHPMEFVFRRLISCYRPEGY